MDSEGLRTGRAYLDDVTTLLRLVRRAHPTKGLFEAADLQWWWRAPRPTDEIPQLFWFDEDGRPTAAVIVTAWRDRTALDPILLPDATAEWTDQVVERGLAHAGASGFGTVQLEADRSDETLIAAFVERGFSIDENEQMVETWMDADSRPAVSPLADGYRLFTRLERAGCPHHMVSRNGPDTERRLNETSLYRPDLDLVVVDRNDDDAAYALFWMDPATATGLVEPMRTEDAHQRQGLARHVLIQGLERLAAAGAKRIKICFEAANPASKHLYLSVGFRPVKETVTLSGPTLDPASSPGGCGPGR